MKIYDIHPINPADSNEAMGADITGEATEGQVIESRHTELHPATVATIEGLRKIIRVAPSTPFTTK